jgi:hypothetical protein
LNHRLAACATSWRQSSRVCGTLDTQ